MHRTARTSGQFLLAVGLLAGLALAHEDDPKILDRKAPVSSQGFRRALPQGGVSVPAGVTLAGTNFASNNVQLLAWIPLNLIDNSSSGNDCWGYVSGTGREIGIIGTQAGTAFFDLSNPGNPLQIGYVDGPDSLWRDVKVFQTYAYIVSEGGSGIQVVDLANVDSGQVTLVNTITTGGDLASHNVAINTDSGYLYRCGGGSNGLRIYNLNANPAAPSFVG
ncbi:MAG TPA: choice-of-anchor B family protein, partial [Planctomycetota bacterium]|nr:choice-of-anchor B family protein [Planctomycetota bacterium]